MKLILLAVLLFTNVTQPNEVSKPSEFITFTYAIDYDANYRDSVEWVMSYLDEVGFYGVQVYTSNDADIIFTSCESIKDTFLHKLHHSKYGNGFEWLNPNEEKTDTTLGHLMSTKYLSMNENLFDDFGRDNEDLFNRVLLHEVGHFLGLKHYDVPNAQSIMRANVFWWDSRLQFTDYDLVRLNKIHNNIYYKINKFKIML